MSNRVNMHTQTPAQAAVKLIKEYGDKAYWEAEQRMMKATSEPGFDFYMEVARKIDQIKG